MNDVLLQSLSDIGCDLLLFFQAEPLLLMLTARVCTLSNMAAPVFIDFQRGLFCEQSEANPPTIRDRSVQTLMRPQEKGRVKPPQFRADCPQTHEDSHVRTRSKPDSWGNIISLRKCRTGGILSLLSSLIYRQIMNAGTCATAVNGCIKVGRRFHVFLYREYSIFKVSVLWKWVL